MKTCSAPLLSLLSGNSEFVVAELLSIALANGTTLYYSSVDSDITYGGHTYLSGVVLLHRSKIHQVCGIETDELEINCYPTPTATIGGIGWMSAVRNGALDGASVTLQRVFYPSWGATATGAYNLFTGYVSDIEMARTYAILKIQSQLELLSTPWPFMVYQPNCVWQLYGSGCGLTKASWTVSGLVAAGTLGVSAFSTNLTQADDYFDLGVITFTSGNNSGAVRTIKKFLHSAGLLSLIYPLNNLPVAGDAFSIYPGCDHTLVTCTNKFSNNANIRSFPYVPVPETCY